MAIVARVSPRTRIVVVVSVLGLAAGGAVAGVALVTGGGEAKQATNGAVTRPRRGAPPLVLDLGVRADAQAAALRRAEALYNRGDHKGAARIFTRYGSTPAQVGFAFSSWPNGTLARMRTIAGDHPRDAFVLLHLGLASFWAGRNAEAVAAWRAAERTDPDTPSAVAADDLLHPGFPRGLPAFVPSFSPPDSVQRLPPGRQLAALAHAAVTGGARAKILYGVTLQHLGHPVSAKRWFARAAAQAPGDAEAQVAADVGRFTKANPSAAFSRLGPLVRRFPRAPTVRFHLALLLLWLGRIDAAKRELVLAKREGPTTPIGREAGRFLARLESIQK